MDYRELENRMERNRDMIRERAHDKLVEELQKAKRAERTTWFASLRMAIASRFKRRESIVQPPAATPVPINPHQIKQH